MLKIDLNKPKYKPLKNDDYSLNINYHRLSIPYHIFFKPKFKKDIYNGDESTKFQNRKRAYKRILREEALKIIDKLELPKI